jgi:hypothetical protein
MYVNIKMIPVETIAGMRCVIISENYGLGEFQNDKLQELL